MPDKTTYQESVPAPADPRPAPEIRPINPGGKKSDTQHETTQVIVPETRDK